MSQFSPSNPYNAPVASSFDPNATDRTLGGFTKFLLIMFVVFGVLGVAGGCLGLVQTIGALAVTSAATGVGGDADAGAADAGAMVEGDGVAEPTADGNDPFAADGEADGAAAEGMDEEARVRRMTEAAQNAFPGAMAIQIALQLVSMIVSVLMLIGGIFGLQRKKIGASLVRGTSAFMIPFKMVESGIGGYITWKVMEIGKDEFGRELNRQGAPDFDPAAFFQIIAVAALAGIIIWGLVLIAFYLVAFLHMGKASVSSKFE
ncbi:hypothetical protein VN12_18405 [Pirellula sp. SH-Sr6A]|uniref:hypothetical protein n=1 Tax=Pirellula sp. SH-Sr6A TaxID=1632865 RepID=UPI00078BB4CD|nr:hypothetical protein [Pirellula sp. SH-Sr6A]AMV34108.1 hypothetical protein VN12_18405 [Pirellula sp. SH-Sr6A]